ncbi:acyltransferase family protein [Permianibacter sp. IMCC34836]|uniref:acyltransferase family protein n=1 Tax=Permianibacter fluminis TaxID=2738515 RepID=UPI0015563A7C|nr:acyltransferase family protein [Permianibacter fluminis]NQD39101.1 acyltransferase family protein [Permianibacter fluminis]
MTTIAAPTPAERAEFLDCLRIIAIGFLLLFHTGMLFVGWGWHIENAETATSLVMPMDIAHRLRMPLLFVIAGASIFFALGRRSTGAVLKERTLRLFLPLVAGMFLIVPPQIYFERLFRGQWQGDYFHYYVEKVLQFQAYPQGDFSWHHLWFIVYLFVYCLVLMPLFARWRKGLSIQPGRWLYALALPIGINEAVLKPLFPETHNLTRDWYTFNHYALLFIYGFVLAAVPGSWDWLMRTRRQSLLVGVALVVAILTLKKTGLLVEDTPFDAVTANLFTWTWLLVFFGYGKRWLSFSNGLLRYLREATYPVYILHQTVIIAIGYYVIQQPWSWGSKYLVVLGLTTVICLMLYELLIKRVALLRLLFGLKPRRPSLAAPVSVLPVAQAVGGD